MQAWQRLRSDYELGIITSFGACAVLGILPFSIYRFSIGNIPAGMLDLGIVASIWFAVVHAWRNEDRRRARLFLAVINTLACLASASLLGPPGLFWMYPALLGNFLLLRPNGAVLASALALVFLAVQGKAYDSPSQLAMFLVSATVSGLIAFIFAARTERQRAELEMLATMDMLTGVPNRRAMEAELQVAVEQFHRSGAEVGLAMLDLDHFKSINDLHGHEAGDGVLVDFARIVRHSIRKADRCFRFGGEEFVLLMPGSGAMDLRAIDDSLRQRIASELRCRGQGITVSIGAAALRPGEDWQAWLSRADAALYRAKAEGRNCTVVDDALPEAVEG